MSWESLNGVLTGLFLALVSGTVVLLRKVFTSEAKIQLLESSLEEMKEDFHRREDKLDEKLSVIEADIKNLMSR